jgi:multiple sugar transport system substrate-binding protein
MTDLRNRFWGFSNWYQSYSAGGNPNAFYFDPQTGKPMINSEAGIRATKWHVDTLKFHSPDAISWGWPEQYANFSAGGAAMSCMYPNAPKFLDNPDNADSVVVGKMLSGVTPGYVTGGQLIRRPVWWPNITLGVSTQSKFPEAAYLLLQWLSSTSIYTWMTGNPAGYFDPFQVTDFVDPGVVASYKPWHIPVYTATIERAVPPITLNGANEYVNALDDNLQAAMTQGKTPEQAMEDTAAEWEKISDRLGRDKQIVAMKALADTYPTITDTPTITT